MSSWAKDVFGRIAVWIARRRIRCDQGMPAVVVADGGEELHQQLVVACLQLSQDIGRHVAGSSYSSAKKEGHANEATRCLQPLVSDYLRAATWDPHRLEGS